MYKKYFTKKVLLLQKIIKKHRPQSTYIYHLTKLELFNFKMFSSPDCPKDIISLMNCFCHQKRFKGTLDFSENKSFWPWNLKVKKKYFQSNLNFQNYIELNQTKVLLFISKDIFTCVLSKFISYFRRLFIMKYFYTMWSTILKLNKSLTIPVRNGCRTFCIQNFRALYFEPHHGVA